MGLLFFKGFGLGFIVFRVSAFFQACLRILQGIGLGVLLFRYGLSFIRVSVWLLLLLGLRPGFDRF